MFINSHIATGYIASWFETDKKQWIFLWIFAAFVPGAYAASKRLMKAVSSGFPFFREPYKTAAKIHESPDPRP